MSLDIERYIGRSRALDLSDIDWDSVGRFALSAEVRRTLRYMQDIESYTIMYLHELLATRVVDDPDVATFLACWLYEETFHGRALAKFLNAAGDTISPTPRSRVTLSQRLEHIATRSIARAWPDFVAVHMTWGAINELTTLAGYRQLAARANHPVLASILGRIVRDESRHFHFYFEQAQQRLAHPRTARITRFIVDHFWAPVGAGVQPREETRFLAQFLFGDAEGRAGAQRVDETIRRLPGFADADLLEAWVTRHCQPATRGAHVQSRIGLPAAAATAPLHDHRQPA
jgi:hypothetical protein